MLNWIRTTWDYNYWAHRKLWDCIMSISDADFKKPFDYSIGSIHEQVVHTMWAEAIWYARLHDEERPTFTAEDYPERAAIRAKWDDVEAKWRAYLNRLTPDQVDRTFEVVRANGESYIHSVRDVLMQVVNHGTDHRAQMLQLIHHCGGETFAQDIIYYFREQQTSSQVTS